MNLAEQAALRLEQLARAGVSVPWSAAKAAAPNAASRKPPHTLASLDLQRLREAGYLVPDPLHSELKEQFRHLKRPLLETARAQGADPLQRGGQIMVTSALRGEGKTFCAVNLAMSMAMEIDTAVILIDADVVRPSVFARLGITTRPPGLLDLLAGTVNELPQALVGTDVPKLLLMGSGEPSLRVFGRFVAQDYFAALTWESRANLGKPPWRGARLASKTVWTRLFYPYPPLSGADLHDYLSTNAFRI